MSKTHRILSILHWAAVLVVGFLDLGTYYNYLATTDLREI